jgi:uncharacterized protein (TIGR02646 family)
MRSLPLPIAPPCLTAMAISRPNGPWFDGSVRSERIARKWVRRGLVRNQQSNCGWCESKITLASSHSEHICPKSNPSFASLTFAIGNLMACCGKSSSPTCGHAKGNNVLAAWVHPYYTATLETRFVYEVDGEMAPHPSLDVGAKTEALDAINWILKLNHSVLKSQREALIDDILNNPTYEGLSHDDLFLIVGEFKSLIEQYAS